MYHILGRARERTPRAQQVERAVHPFVGRTQELATLQALWTQAQAGRGHVVGLVGESGIGKSRLLHEFRQSLQEQRALYLAGRCFSYGQTVPYFSMIDLLRQNCGMADTDPPATLIAKVHRGLQELGMVPEEWAPYLLHLLGIADETEATASLTPQTLKGRIMETFLHMWLHSGQRAPVLLALEDLHWIDASSEECLTALVERLVAMPALLLVTYRPGYRLPWLERSYVTQLALSRLTVADSLQMVQSALQAAQVPAPLMHQLLHKADGNPFFLEELVRTVIEQGSQATLLTTPDTVQAVLAARIDRLPAQAKRLLQAAAVVGRDIWLPLLQALVPLPEAEFQEHLRYLQQIELLHETAFFPEPIYTFHHVLTQEVAYQSLLTTTRQQLHAQTAQLLAERFPHLVEQQPELLAHHYTAAGLSHQALAYWQRAGRRALRRAAHAEAIAHLTQGLEVLKTLPETPERHEHEVTLQLFLSAAGVKRPRTITI
jgi:predicted ATPase